MEEKEPLDIFKLIVEKKLFVILALLALFLLFSDPTKASVFIGIVFSVSGEMIRTLSFGEANKKEGLVTTGTYSYLRHPVYLGDFLAILGILIMGNVFIFTVLYGIIFYIIYSEKIKLEEEELRDAFKEEFEDYALNVPTFIPRFMPLSESGISFDFDMLKLNDEYQIWVAIYAITILMFLMT